MKNRQTGSLNLAPSFSIQPKQEVWRIRKAHKKKTASILLPFPKLSCGYVPTLSFPSCLTLEKKEKKKTGEIYFPLLGEQNNWQNHLWPRSDPEHLQSTAALLPGLRTMQTIVSVLLSVPSTQGKVSSKTLLGQQLSPLFSQITWAGFRQGVCTKQLQCFRGRTICILKGIFLTE